MRQRVHDVADEVRRRLGPREEEEGREPDRLAAGEHLLAVGHHERREQVLLRLELPLVDPRPQVVGQLHHGEHLLLAEPGLAGAAAHHPRHRVGPPPEVAGLGRVRPDQLADDPHGERRRQPRDHVERLARDRLAEELLDDLVHVLAPRLHAPRGEPAVDDAAQVAVVRRVDRHEHALGLVPGEALLPGAGGLAHQDAAHRVRGEQPGLGQRPGHVLVAGEHERARLRGPVHRGVVAQLLVQPVDVGGSVVEGVVGDVHGRSPREVVRPRRAGSR